MADVPLTDTDVWTASPQGPGPSHPLTNTIWRSFYDQINNRVRWVRNRLTDSVLGSYQAIEAVDPGTDIITITGHGRSNGDVVRVESQGGTVPAGLAAKTAYYVAVQDADNIKLKNTAGAGLAINITGAGSGDLYLVLVPDSFGALVSQAASTVGTYTMPKAFSLKDLLAYVASTLGTTFTGAVLMVGTSARVVKRTPGALPDSDSTLDVSTDTWYQATPTAQRDHEVLDASGTVPVENDEVEVRRGAAGAFAIILHREGQAGAICTLPASTCCSARLKYRGAVWTLLSYSGAVVPGADAG
jgi:hypothetical protein